MHTFVAMAIVTSTMLQSPADEDTFQNLKVLPQDISQGELGDLMLENLRGLGLRRTAGEGCLCEAVVDCVQT